MAETPRPQATPEAAPFSQRELPLSPFQAGLVKACEKLAGRPRYCALNAVRGLRRAWLIAELDPEIALFRAITAEEEAATALLFALRQRRYPGAKALNPYRHADKTGLSILVRALGKVFADAGWPQPLLQLSKETKRPRIDIHVPSEGLGLGAGHHVTPDEPLNLSIRRGSGDEPGRITLFAVELSEIAKGAGADSIRSHIEAEADLRNTLLYASDDGMAVVERPDGFILERLRRVFVLIGLTIIVLQTRQHQLLAVQAIEAYLSALGRSTADLFDYTPAAPLPDVEFEITRTTDGQPAARVRRRTT
jgi:hypothetical protein